MFINFIKKFGGNVNLGEDLNVERNTNNLSINHDFMLNCYDLCYQTVTQLFDHCYYLFLAESFLKKMVV